MLCLSPVREPPQKWAGPGVEWTGRPFEAARYTDVSEADPRGSRFLRVVTQRPVQRDSSTASPVPSTVDGAREARRDGLAGSQATHPRRVNRRQMSPAGHNADPAKPRQTDVINSAASPSVCPA